MAEQATVKPKTAAQLKAEYDALLKQVQASSVQGRKLELQLLEDVKKKVKAAAGDLEALQGKKRAAFAAWQQQEFIEAASAKADKEKATAVALAAKQKAEAAAIEKKAGAGDAA